MLESWWHDLRLAWRGLRRARGFTAAAVLTLAVGMAGVTAMFALIQGVLLRPLPMPEPDRLVTSWKEHRSSGSTHWPFNAAEVALIRDATSQVFSSVTTARPTDRDSPVPTRRLTASSV